MDQESAAVPTAAVPTPPPTEPAKLQPIPAITAGWATFKREPWMGIAALVVTFLALSVGTVIPILGWLLVGPALTAGCAGFMLRTSRGESLSIENVFDGFRRWSSVTGAILLVYAGLFAIELVFFGIILALLATKGVLTSNTPLTEAFPPWVFVMIGLGLVVVFVFVFVWWCRTALTYFIVMEPDQPGAVEAFKRSWRLTRGSVWRLAGLGALCIPVWLLGVLALCVGVIPAYVVMYCAFAHAYDQLRARAGWPVPAAAPQDEPAPQRIV